MLNYDHKRRKEKRMAYPFGEMPTLSQYLAWAASEGCEIKHGVDMVSGIGEKLILIGEQSLCIVDMPDGETLTPTTVNNFDRRLMLKSPFPSWQ